MLYLFRHKWFVFLECLKYGLVWRGIVHDLSKFLPSEFFPYLRFFYLNNAKRRDFYGEGEDEEFDEARKKHRIRNSHHWQHWLLEGGGCLSMPDKYRKEMLADWKAMKRTFKIKDVDGETKRWYLKYRKEMVFHEETSKWLTKELGIKE